MCLCYVTVDCLLIPDSHYPVFALIYCGSLGRLVFQRRNHVVRILLVKSVVVICTAVIKKAITVVDIHAARNVGKHITGGVVLFFPKVKSE